MLFIHFFEGNGPKRLQITEMFLESSRRDDQISASCLTIGELLAGARVQHDARTEAALRTTLDEMRIELLPFDRKAINIFAELRSAHHVKAPDAINLACAGAAGVDLFLTEDKALLKLHVPGVKFIAPPSAGLI